MEQALATTQASLGQIKVVSSADELQVTITGDLDLAAPPAVIALFAEMLLTLFYFRKFHGGAAAHESESAGLFGGFVFVWVVFPLSLLIWLVLFREEIVIDKTHLRFTRRLAFLHRGSSFPLAQSPELQLMEQVSRVKGALRMDRKLRISCGPRRVDFFRQPSGIEGALVVLMVRAWREGMKDAAELIRL